MDKVEQFGDALQHCLSCSMKAETAQRERASAGYGCLHTNPAEQAAMSTQRNAFTTYARSETRVKDLWARLSADEKAQVKSRFDHYIERLEFELK